MQDNNNQKFQRKKLAYFSNSFVNDIQNIFPDYDFVPFLTAIKEKEKITALVGFDGRGEFLAKLFGFKFWHIHEGLYRLLGHKPCSLMLEREGNYKDATRASEWEKLMHSIPALLNHYEKIKHVHNQTDLSQNNDQNNELPKISDQENEHQVINQESSEYINLLIKQISIAFPALAPYDKHDATQMLNELFTYRLSSDKYAPDASPHHLTTPSGRKKVVILDEEKQNRFKLKKVMASEKTFFEMISAAKKNHPGAAFFLLEPKTVRSDKKKGYLRKVAEANGVQVLQNDVSSISILSQADVVYTVASQLGLDAIFLGKKIYCFGMPFYAGWGLTKDSIKLDRRNVKRSREEIFAAFCLFMTRYRHPITSEPSSFREILRFIILQRPLNFERNRYIACIHFDENLITFCKQFFAHANLHFFSEDNAIKNALENNGIILTGIEPDLAMRKKFTNIPLVHVDHGVIDRLLGNGKYVSLRLEGGPYPTLEKILQTVVPGEKSLLRARLFRQYLRETSALREHIDITHIPLEQNIILLVGNILNPPRNVNNLGEVNIHDGNLDSKGLPLNSFSSPLADDFNLIKHVRKLRPYDYIIYCPQMEHIKVPKNIEKMVNDTKPFTRPSDFIPLSLLGLETDLDTEKPEDFNEKEENTFAHFVDDVYECKPNVRGKNCSPWSRKYVAAKRFLEKAHKMTTVSSQFCPLYFPVHSIQGHKIEVHTHDSYLGLDALSVGMDVFTYGWPFYAGWGLTIDAENFPLRTQNINVDTLFAGTFILQPRYFDTVNDIFCEPENAPYLLMRD